MGGSGSLSWSGGEILRAKQKTVLFKLNSLPIDELGKGA